MSYSLDRSRKADAFHAGKSLGAQLLDGHVHNRASLGFNLPADLQIVFLQFAVELRQQNDFRVFGDPLLYLRVFEQIAAELRAEFDINRGRCNLIYLIGISELDC